METVLKRPVVSFFTSFNLPVGIEDTDADMLEGILQNMDLSQGLALIISSPGGDGLAAERIINLCRNYSETGEYWAIVPNKAKSAATIICLGASKVYMGVTSELGPIDPQVMIVEDDKIKRYSVYNIIHSYRNLFNRAVNEQGRLEPYLLQLENYDERDITEFEAAYSLSKSIAVRALKSGMMRSSKRSIEKKIEVFTNPELTLSHGRPIYGEEVKNCGLNIELMNTRELLWKMLFELYIRTNRFVSTQAAKCIENKTHSFIASIGGEKK